jgi:hypothetical protein
MITQRKLKEILHYDPKTGLWTWLVSRGCVKVGTKAGVMSKGWYRIIRIDKKNYGAHRLAILYMTGKFPPFEVDHINGVIGDNRYENLRLATHQQNISNQKRHKDKKGLKGTWLTKHKRRWKATIFTKGKNINLGYFDTEIEAHLAYCAAAKKYHGEFARAS